MDDKFWTSERRSEAVKCFKQHERKNYKDALTKLNARWGTHYDYDAIASAFRRHELQRPLDYCGRDTTPVSEMLTSKIKMSETADRLRSFVKSHKEVSFDACLDHLHTYPKKLDELFKELRAHGFCFDVSRESVAKPDAWVNVQRDDEIAVSKIAPTKGGWYFALVISDQHYCNRHSQEGMIEDVIGWATEDLKIKKIYGAGDWVDGIYSHGKNERKCNSVTDQYEYLCEKLPRKEGVEYEGILGNHDLTFWTDGGLPVAEFVTKLFRDKGRKDIKLYEAIRLNLRAQGPVKDRGPVIQLAHPCIPGSKSPAKKSAYAITYPLQKEVEGFTEIKPDIFLMGHFHKFGYAYVRGVQAIMLPCALGPGSMFSQTFVGSPALGAVVIGWQLSELGMIRHFFVMPSWYHSREKIHEQRNTLPSIPIDEMFAH